jgi:Tfp pilus assembly protein PilN
VFTINFRREVFVRERARVRARLFALGGWLLYFGLLVVVVGLYTLNCASLLRRVASLQRQTQRLQSAQGTPQDWTVDQTQLAAVERFESNPRRWRDKLLRITALLPEHVALTSLAVNPENSSNAADQDKLVLSGQMRATPGQDATRGVVQLVSLLQKDKVFASGYQTIKLTQSRAVPGNPHTELGIECP